MPERVNRAEREMQVPDPFRPVFRLQGGQAAPIREVQGGSAGPKGETSDTHNTPPHPTFRSASPAPARPAGTHSL